ncbi:hypothetical protein QL285_071878 [Trifolium repens]|nr:hypothetical protein QL285_071878 [Trifolium repens]
MKKKHRDNNVTTTCYRWWCKERRWPSAPPVSRSVTRSMNQFRSGFVFFGSDLVNKHRLRRGGGCLSAHLHNPLFLLLVLGFLRWSAGSPELCFVCALGCCLINPSWVVKPPSAPPRWSSFLAGGGSPLHCLVVINLFAFCFRWALSTEISQMSDVFISALEIFAVLLNSSNAFGFVSVVPVFLLQHILIADYFNWLLEESFLLEAFYALVSSRLALARLFERTGSVDCPSHDLAFDWVWVATN